MNLDRLKGTNLLVRGFEEFVAKWVAHQDSSGTPIQLDGDALEIWSLLPDQVKEFYELVNRVPESNICGNRNQDTFIFPPRYQKKWSGRDWVVDQKFASLAVENQGNWEVVISLTDADLGKLYCDQDKEGNYPGEWQPMATQPEEFLVTLGFHELIMTGAPMCVEEDSVIGNASTIFHGHYVCDEPINVIYHPDGHLWLADEQNRSWWSSSKPV